MKDNRYNAVRTLIKAREIKKFTDIFEIIPVTIVSQDAGIHKNTLYRKVKLPNLLTMDEVLSLARAFEIEVPDIIPVIVQSISENQDKRKGVMNDVKRMNGRG